MIILDNYKILCRNGVYYVVPEEVPACPVCGGPVKVRDSRRRKLIRDDGKSDLFSLRRLRCPNCQTLHLEIPDIMIPYRRYDKESMEGAVNGTRRDCPADNATIYRWKHRKKEEEKSGNDEE